MFITNNHASFYLWWKKLLKYQKILKYCAYDCISLNFCSSNNLRQQQYIITKFVCILRFGLKLLRGFSNSDSKLLMRWEGRQNSWGIGFFALLENQFWFAGNLNKSWFFEVIFVPHSHGIFYLTFKKLAVSLEKDCFDHVIFRRDLFLFLM